MRKRSSQVTMWDSCRAPGQLLRLNISRLDLEWFADKLSLTCLPSAEAAFSELFQTTFTGRAPCLPCSQGVGACCNLLVCH
eukprot:747964-Hanusia_phi.AAC.2